MSGVRKAQESGKSCRSLSIEEERMLEIQRAIKNEQKACARKKYNDAHKEERAKREAELRKANPEKYHARDHESYMRRKGRIKEYRKTHREQIRAWDRKWRSEHREEALEKERAREASYREKRLKLSMERRVLGKVEAEIKKKALMRKESAVSEEATA